MSYIPPRYDGKTYLIYIDSFKNGVPIGHYHNPCREDSGQFQSLTELLLKLEQSLDVENIPQSFHKVRTFFPLTGYWLDEPADERMRRGKMGTFAVQILFRRNASWQGTITWLDQKQTQNFRSVLELIVLMNSALEGTKFSPWQMVEEYREIAE